MTRIRLFSAFLAIGSAAVAATPQDCRLLEKHGQEIQAGDCYESLVSSRDPAVRAEGLWGVGLYAEALKQFDAAAAAQPGNANILVRRGRLFLDRFNLVEAQGDFQKALDLGDKNPQAYLGLALVAAEGFEGQAAELATKAIELDPNLVEAHELLANLALEDNDPDGAVKAADQAIKLSGDALDAMAIHAAVDVLADQSPDAWLAKIDNVNPHYGQARAIVGHHLVLNRRYTEGIDYYRKAIALSPKLWSARSQLGVNLMRLGQEEEARTQLEMCYNNGWTDALTSNSLKLIDSYKNFVTFKTDNTILKLHKKEADLLHPYFESELKRAIATYEKKYQMKLPRPVQVEVYPDHEDFAVRTMGMPGLGALGVTFIDVIAMDSPSGRPPGEFHWASTMWHELSHVFVLTATQSRVPRWFTEGVAVYEETAAAPDWGDRINVPVIKALQEKKLLPVADLDRGFIHPSYPNQVIVSYFQGGRIIDYIVGRWGFSKVLDMMHAYADKKSTPEVIREQLGMEPEAFDKLFLDWVNQSLTKTIHGYDQWRKDMVTLVKEHEDKDYGAVIAQAPGLIEIYPDYVEHASAYQLLADSYIEKGDKVNAEKILKQYADIGGRDPATLKELSKLQEEHGKPKEAAATLERLNLIYPVNDEELHRRLGDLWFAQSNFPGALREYNAVLAMNPIDKAEAQYNVARAYHATGDNAMAEKHVMSALEAAPGFRSALRLLLDLEDSKKAKETR